MFSKEGHLSHVSIADADIAPSAAAPVAEPVSSRRDPMAARRSSCEESLVVDERSGIRPARAVESKLTSLLKEASMPASRLQMRAMLKAR